MSPWGFSSLFFPATGTQSSRERSRPASVYNSYSTRTASAPTPVSYHSRSRSSSSKPRADYNDRRHRHSYSDSYGSYDSYGNSYGSSYGNSNYSSGYDNYVDHDYEYDYPRSHSSKSSSTGSSSYRAPSKSRRSRDPRDYREKPKEEERRVHWADEQPPKSSARRTSKYNYDDDYYRGDSSYGASAQSPKSPRHSSFGYHGYDEEVDRRSRKTRTGHRRY